MLFILSREANMACFNELYTIQLLLRLQNTNTIFLSQVFQKKIFSLSLLFLLLLLLLL